MAVHKYQIKLLELYKHLGSSWEKTPNLIKDKLIESSRDLTKLNYLRRKKAVIVSGYKAIQLENPTISDKHSNWWKVSAEGLYMIAEVFGRQFIRKEDFKLLTKYYLKESTAQN